MAQEQDQQVRELKYRLKNTNKTVGKQGETIYRLRSELAEVRATHSKIDRGDLRRLERVNQELVDYIVTLEAKLAAAQDEVRETEPDNTALQEVNANQPA